MLTPQFGNRWNLKQKREPELRKPDKMPGITKVWLSENAFTNSAREADALTHHCVVIHKTAQKAAGLLPFAEKFIAAIALNCKLSYFICP